MNQSKDPISTVDIEFESSMSRYLLAHPDFFERRRELLTYLRVPHAAGPAVSLIERQVAVLREKAQTLEGRLSELISVARENERVYRRMHGLALTLLSASDGAAVIRCTSAFLRDEFRADLVTFRLFGDGSEGILEPGALAYVQRNDPALAPFARFLDAGRSVCGLLRPEQLAFLFRDRALEVRSAALVALGKNAKLGILGIGSCERQRFEATMGTVFLDQIGELITAALKAPV
jgi:uncharacterized protein YigA (DUF484 family)